MHRKLLAGFAEPVERALRTLEGGEHRGAIPCCSLIATGDSLIHTCPPAPEVGQIPLDRRARDRPEIVRTRDIALQRAPKTDYAGKPDPGPPGRVPHESGKRRGGEDVDHSV